MHETIGGPVMPVLDPEVMTPPPELPPGSLYTHYLNQELNLNGYNTNVGQLFRLCPFYDQIHDQELTPEKLEELDQYTAKFLATGGIEISNEFVHLVKTTETPKPEQPD